MGVYDDLLAHVALVHYLSSTGPSGRIPQDADDTTPGKVFCVQRVRTGACEVGLHTPISVEGPAGHMTLVFAHPGAAL